MFPSHDNAPLMHRLAAVARSVAASALLGGLVLAGATHPSHAAETYAFGGIDFTWVNPGSPTPNFIWHTGDSWSQTFSTGIGSLGELGLSLSFNSNVLQLPLNMEVDVNSIAIGTFTINPGDSGFTATFDAGGIAGTSFAVQLVALNTIPTGSGSVSLRANSVASTVTFAEVPEPLSLGILGMGLMGLAVARSRRRQA